MFEKVSMQHPDKLADRIAGAIVDLAYATEENPKIAVEVLLGHGECTIIAETSVELDGAEVLAAVERIAGEDIDLILTQIPQDEFLAKNQQENIRCGDNGIFCGMPVTEEQEALSAFARKLYEICPYDGKYILADRKLIVCQSNITDKELDKFIVEKFPTEEFADFYLANPIGGWVGGTDVDTGATNRKLGSDMGDAVTGGGLHGKDLSKADVSVNIYAHLKAQKTGEPVELYCAIGDEVVDGVPYSAIVEMAREYINEIGGFEKFAEWGLI